jgi:hypothetical protein
MDYTRHTARPGQSRCGGLLQPCCQPWSAFRTKLSAAHGPYEPPAYWEGLTREERQRCHDIQQRPRSLHSRMAYTTPLVSGVLS